MLILQHVLSHLNWSTVYAIFVFMDKPFESLSKNKDRWNVMFENSLFLKTNSMDKFHTFWSVICGINLTASEML